MATKNPATTDGAPTLGTLIVCPTPLGNLGDITQRAVDVLRQADCVCCEDTRVTGRLLAALGVHTRLERLDEAVLGQRAPGVIERVRAGQTIAYCSDAGMPGVSDPGQRLVAAARQAGVSVQVLPGPTAVVTAYVASGFTCPRFYFGGFFPRKEGERAAALCTVASLDAVAIFYESPHRLVAALTAIAQALPERPVAVCRELTKIHEEVLVDEAEKLVQDLIKRQEQGAIKGEVVIVIDAPGEGERVQHRASVEQSAAEEAARLLAEGGLSKKDIVARLQREFGISRNAAYGLVHASEA